MAAKDKPSKGPSTPSGVRGPGGPPPAPSRGSAGTGGSSARRPAAGRPSGFRARLEQASYPALVRLRRIPRWLMVILPAVLLFAGLVMPAGLAWLGGILLAIVGLFLAWLLLLSWPVLSAQSKLLRLIVIVAVFGIAFFKAMGRI